MFHRAREITGYFIAHALVLDKLHFLYYGLVLIEVRRKLGVKGFLYLECRLFDVFRSNIAHNIRGFILS